MQISFQFALDLICIRIPMELIFIYELAHQFGALLIHSCFILARNPEAINIKVSS
jgi:hypothetical protein